MFGKHRGIHPKDNKEYTAKKPIESLPLPKQVVLPLRQHIGAPCVALVKKGEMVKKGQMIGHSVERFSSPVHASISGKVVDITEQPHPTLGSCQAVILESDGLDEWLEGMPATQEWEQLPVQALIQEILDAGIVGLGGAAFPTHIKVAIPEGKQVDTLVVNAAECEPYLTADHRMMLEHTDRIVTGIKIVKKILGDPAVIVGIEDNKTDAATVMERALHTLNARIVKLPTQYPQGAEKVLIRVLTGREVGPGKLPVDVGVVVQNVGTLAAVSDAVTRRIPLIERVITVSGSAVKEPKNLLVRLGTSMAEIVDYCEGLVSPPEKIIIGGPMMGVAQSTLDVPVVKGVSGILCLSKKDVHSDRESNCIRCGRCVSHCPLGLNPFMFSRLGERGMYREAKEDHALLNCFECGTCSYVCPAKRNIVQYVRYLKALNVQQTQKTMRKSS